MATTTTDPEARDIEALGYAEDDKLGPLAGKRSIIDDDAELRRVLVAEFEAAADAVRAAAGSVDQSATAAVHGYRKALRRARAVLSLVAGALPRSERRAVSRALRDARRALGSVRDHAVAPDALGLVTLDDTEQVTVNAILATAGEAVPPLADIKQLLAEGAARTAAQVEALEAALPPIVRWSTVLRGMRGIYKQARRARRNSKRSRRAFHAWRRRTKELIYQLDVLGGYTGSKIAQLQRDLEAVAETQRPAVDLIMLRDFTRTHGAGVSPDALDRLVGAIDVEVDERLDESRRAGRDAFARSPRRFAKKLAKAARHDVACDPVPDDVD